MQKNRTFLQTECVSQHSSIEGASKRVINILIIFPFEENDTASTAAASVSESLCLFCDDGKTRCDTAVCVCACVQKDTIQ